MGIFHPKITGVLENIIKIRKIKIIKNKVELFGFIVLFVV